MSVQDLKDFSDLRNHPGYQKLQLLWQEQGKDIMTALNKASREKSKDESLRWHAGSFYGFDLAIGQLDRAIADVTRKLENTKVNEGPSVEEVLRKLGERKGESQ
jgi:hypothetical protein